MIGCLALLPALTQAQCSQYPTLELGNDTVLCPGTTYSLQVAAGYDSYNWSTGSTLTGITISAPGTYSLSVLNTGPTLVINGDFENGDTGFTSSYVHGTGGAFGELTDPGTYAVSTSPSNVHNNFSVCSDHTTTGPGNMLIANGAGTPNVSVWCQTITVTPGTDYLFSAWIGNALNDPNVSNLQFFVNNVQIGNVFSTSPNACNWTQFSNVWNSGASTTADLCIRNQNTSGGGNDFVLDDIAFQPVCTQTDSIHVTYDNLSVSAGPDVAFCANETDQFQATSNTPNTQLIWGDGTTGSTYTPTASGTYTVHATSVNGCYVSDSAVATITPMPWDIDTIYVGPTSCGSTDGYVSVATNGTFNNPPLYTWNGPGANNPNQIDASVWENLSVGWYYISIESAGCFRYDSALVTPLNPPVAQMSGTPLTGYAPLNVTFTNTSINGISYQWVFGNGNTASATDLSGQTQTYTDPGTYTAALIVTNGSCTDTAYVTIVVTTPPVIPPPAPIVPVSINVPNVFTPDGDNINDIFTFDLENIKELEVTILNRWGNTVYQSNSTTSFWDGKANSGGAASEGVYFYKYKAVGAQNEQLNGHGMVELFRK